MGEEESKSVQLALRTESDNGASLKLNIGYNEDKTGQEHSHFSNLTTTIATLDTDQTITTQDQAQM